MVKLGVNIDHVATLRQARGECDPDPINAAKICERAGAHSIVAHLREDRRHIQDQDVFELKRVITTRFNLEMSLNPGILKIALKVKPHQATIVPERRQEITTEGGLDVVKHFKKIQRSVGTLRDQGIEVSLFIAPDKKQIERSKVAGVTTLEFHTGRYALAKTKEERARQLKILNEATQYARSLNLTVNAGHGLKYDNTRPVAKIDGMNELNIGHSIISRAVFIGLEQAVREMLKIVRC